MTKAQEEEERGAAKLNHPHEKKSEKQKRLCAIFVLCDL